MLNKNEKSLAEFTKYCKAHPEERFWQALRNWNQIKDPEYNFILAAHDPWGFYLEDTFNWE